VKMINHHQVFQILHWKMVKYIFSIPNTIDENDS
jgi:hypothetical protein